MINNQGKTARGGSREIIAYVIQVCDREAEKKC